MIEPQRNNEGYCVSLFALKFLNFKSIIIMKSVLANLVRQGKVKVYYYCIIFELKKKISTTPMRALLSMNQ